MEKVGELKPWGKPGQLGKNWDQVAAELCSPLYPDNTAVFTKLSGIRYADVNHALGPIEIRPVKFLFHKG